MFYVGHRSNVLDTFSEHIFLAFAVVYIRGVETIALVGMTKRVAKANAL